MKRNQTTLFSILGLTTILGGYALYGLQQLPARIEWFQLLGLLFYILIFGSVYLLLLTIIGVVTLLLRKEISRLIFNGIKWSILVFTIIIGMGIFSAQRKVNETAKQMEMK